MEKKHLEIKDKAKCTGCRACEQLCPVKCIEMVEDEEGFIFPKIDEEKCINCGLCKNRCPQLKEKEEERKKYIYAVKPKKVEIAKKSTSAGMAYILMKKTINENGVVFGCTYNEKLEPIQIKVEKEEELQKLRGSKYVFSNTLHTYSEAKKALEESKKVLYIGTPCQIDGLYAFLGKKYENLLTADIVCHGVPSQKIFKKYIEYLENKFKAKVINYEFRNKDKAIWGEFCAKVTMDNGKIKYLNADEDPYYSNFLKGTIYRECCYKCKYANGNRIGDITLADFWGIEKEDSKFSSTNGVSLVIINSLQGKRAFESVEEQIEYKEFSIEQASNKNSNLKHPTKRSDVRNEIYHGINEMDAKNYIKKKLKISNKMKKKIKKFIPKKLKKIIKKMI